MDNNMIMYYTSKISDALGVVKSCGETLRWTRRLNSCSKKGMQVQLQDAYTDAIDALRDLLEQIYPYDDSVEDPNKVVDIDS